MKVVIPIFGFNVSGGIRLLVGLANGLSARGHEVCFAVASGEAGSPFPLERSVGVVELGAPLPIRYVRKLCDAVLLGGMLPRCDVVLANAFLTAYPAYVAVALGRARAGAYFALHYEPLVMGELSERSAPARKVVGAVAAFTYRLPLAKMALSGWVKEQLKLRHGMNSSVVPPFVNLEVFRPSGGGRDEMTVGTVGRRAMWKGMEDLYEAMRIVRGAYEDAKLLVITREELEVPPDVAAEVVRPSLDEELAEAYGACGVFAFPSWYEGFGLPPLEAMACGTPVVVSDSGGVRDFAEDGENCVVVPARNPEALAEGIVRLLGDRELRARLGEAGVAAASAYTLERMVSCAERVFEAELGRKI